MTHSERTLRASEWRISTRTLIGLGLMGLVLMAGVWEAARYGVSDGSARTEPSTAAPTSPAAPTTAGDMLPPASPIRFSDSFARPANPKSLGSDESGQGWEAVRGTWGIDNDAAYISTLFTPEPRMSLAVANVDVADGVFSAIVSGNGVCGLVVRYRDPKNFVMVKRVPLYKVWNIEEFKDGHGERLGFLVDQAADGLQVIVGYRGSSITVSVAGVVHPAVTTSIETSSTAVGLLGEGPTAAQCRWRDAAVASAEP